MAGEWERNAQMFPGGRSDWTVWLGSGEGIPAELLRIQDLLDLALLGHRPHLPDIDSPPTYEMRRRIEGQ